MTPKVSVLLCTYNAEKYIRATLESILHQSYIHIEVCILDNNSQDQTIKIIQSYTDARIHLFPSEKNLGPYGGLNLLLEKATGEYIAIQDHDDIRHPEKIAKQVAFLEKHKKYIWCGTKILMRYEWDQMGFEYFLWKENYYTIHPSLVFRNSQKYRYPETVYMNDALFQKKILCKGEKLIHNIDETLTLHRVRDGANNYSYKWYKLTLENLSTVFSLHPVWYGVLATGFELMRKIVYPVLHRLTCGYMIDRIERVPFRLQGYEVKKYTKKDIEKLFLLDKWLI